MRTTILLMAFFAAVTCRPQLRLSRPQSGLGPNRQPHFVNAAPAPAQGLEPQQQQPQQIPLGFAPRRPLGPAPNVARLPGRIEDDSQDYEDYQNQNAKYQFSSNIEDHINDQTQQREEVRDGANVKGSYSYSDGYYKRTVHYVADENGYQVTGMEAVPLDGPHVDLSGTASVSSSAHGAELRYKVVSVPVQAPVNRALDQH